MSEEGARAERATPGDGLEWVRCGLCGGEESRLVVATRERHLGTGEGFRVVQCLSCGLMYVNPRPVPSAMSTYYPKDYSVFEDRSLWTRPFARFLDRRRAGPLSRLLGGQGRALDVGCGRGELVAALRRAGIEAEGIDPSWWAVQGAVPGAVGHVRHGALETAPMDREAFDLLIFSHVLEHCHDPDKALSCAHRMLRPGGYLYVEVPNAASWEAQLLAQYWGGWDVPRHCYHFSPDTLVRLLRQRGFTVLRVSFSIVPTMCAWGVINLMAGVGSSARVRHILHRLRPFLKLALLPVSTVGAIMHKGGMMSAICKKGDVHPGA